MCDSHQPLNGADSECTHPSVTVIGQEPGTCQVCGKSVVTPAADDHFADSAGNRAMWKVVQ